MVLGYSMGFLVCVIDVYCTGILGKTLYMVSKEKQEPCRTLGSQGTEAGTFRV